MSSSSTASAARDNLSASGNNSRRPRPAMEQQHVYELHYPRSDAYGSCNSSARSTRSGAGSCAPGRGGDLSREKAKMEDLRKKLERLQQKNGGRSMTFISTSSSSSSMASSSSRFYPSASVGSRPARGAPVSQPVIPSVFLGDVPHQRNPSTNKPQQQQSHHHHQHHHQHHPDRFHAQPGMLPPRSSIKTDQVPSSTSAQLRARQQIQKPPTSGIDANASNRVRSRPVHHGVAAAAPSSSAQRHAAPPPSSSGLAQIPPFRKPSGGAPSSVNSGKMPARPALKPQVSSIKLGDQSDKENRIPMSSGPPPSSTSRSVRFDPIHETSDDENEPPSPPTKPKQQTIKFGTSTMLPTSFFNKDREADPTKQKRRLSLELDEKNAFVAGKIQAPTSPMAVGNKQTLLPTSPVSSVSSPLRRSSLDSEPTKAPAAKPQQQPQQSPPQRQQQGQPEPEPQKMQPGPNLAETSTKFAPPRAVKSAMPKYGYTGGAAGPPPTTNPLTKAATTRPAPRSAALPSTIFSSKVAVPPKSVTANSHKTPTSLRSKGGIQLPPKSSTPLSMSGVHSSGSASGLDVPMVCMELAEEKTYSVDWNEGEFGFMFQKVWNQANEKFLLVMKMRKPNRDISEHFDKVAVGDVLVRVDGQDVWDLDLSSSRAQTKCFADLLKRLPVTLTFQHGDK